MPKVTLKNPTHPLIGFSALLACAAIFGSMGILTRFLGANFTAYQQIAFRYTFGSSIGIILALFLRKKVSFNSVPKPFLLLYTFTFPVEITLWTISVLHTTILTTVAVFYAGSLLSSLLVGHFVFDEKISTKKLISGVFTLIGLAMYMYPFSFANLLNIGIIFALLSGLLDTAANSFRKHLSGKMDRLVLALLPMLGGVTLSLILMGASHQLAFPPISLFSWFIGLLFGICVLAISYLTLVGFHNFDLNLGTIVLSAELLFAPIFAYLFLREVPSSQEFVAAFFIGAAIVMMNLKISFSTP